MFDGLDDAYALTPLQQGMLYEVLKNENADLYVAHILVDITGDLNRQHLYRAWEYATRQYETLRTRFVWEGLDEPLQLVNSTVALEWNDCQPVLDEQGDPTQPSDATVDYWLQHERHQALSLSEVPPVRYRLLTFDQNHSVLIWTVHHLLADDWSTPLILQTVADHYDHLASGGEAATFVSKPALPYAAYVQWLSTADQSEHVTWWKKALEGLPETPLVLEKVDHPLPEPLGNQHHRHEIALSAAQSRQIEQLASGAGVTLSTVMHAAWALVVAHHAGTTEAVFGTSVSGRTCPLPDIEQAVGLFLNTLPSRITLAAELSRNAFLQDIQLQLFEQIAHEHLPLTELMKLAPAREGRALFNSVLVVETHGMDLTTRAQRSGVSFGNIRYFTDSNFPLTVLVFPGTSLQLHLTGPATEFSRDGMQALGKELVAVLDDLCVDEDLPMARVLQQQSLRIRGHYPFKPLHSAPPFTHMDHWLDSAVAASTDQPAVVDSGVSYSYRQLWDAAHRIALAIDTQTATAGDGPFVGICLERGFDQIAAMIGVLLSRHGYLPVDPDWPPLRIQSVLEDSEVGCVICDSQSLQHIAPAGICTLLIDDMPRQDSHGGATRRTARADGTTDPAYLLYTSGSTGKPKGVVVSHANLIYSTAARIDYYQAPPERYLLLSAFSFDSSVAGIFWTLCTGGTLVLPGRHQAQDIHEIEQQIAEHAVTHTLCLPSLYALLLRFANRNRLNSLKQVIVAGEACPTTLPKLHADKLPDTLLFNEYGPTEVCVWASVARIDQLAEVKSAGIPLGHGIAGTQLAVLDEQDKLCCPGVSGELVIFSPGVACGYHADDTLTGTRFQCLPELALPETGARGYRSGDTAFTGFDGQIYFLGRQDSQLKIRGQRIEAGEIENRVARHPAVLEACCIAQTCPESDEGLGHDTRLICYYSLCDDTGDVTTTCTVLDKPELRERLANIEQYCSELINKELPASFRVTAFVAVTTLPRLPNGKLDRRSFPLWRGTEAHNLAGDVTPLTAGETPGRALLRQLCQQLASLLNVPAVRPEDNFFALGGDSLNAIRYVAACREQGIRLSVPMVAASLSMAALAEQLEQAAETPACSQQESPPDSTGNTPLSPMQRWFFSLGMPRQSRWSMAFNIGFDSAFGVAQVEQALRRTVAEFPVLFSRFPADLTSEFCIPAEPHADVTIKQASSGLSEQEWISTLATLQDSFNLENGMLLGCLLAVDKHQHCRQLGVVVHHLVTDALSNWQLARRLSHHLHSGTEAAPPATATATETPSPSPSPSPSPTESETPTAGHTQVQPPSMAATEHASQDNSVAPVAEYPSRQQQTFSDTVDALSFREWCLRLTEAIGPGDDTGHHPGKPSAQPLIESNCVEYRLELDGAQMATINHDCQRWQMELHEYLLFVIASQSPQQGHLRLDVETHGRDLLDDGRTAELDASSSVGWFSSFFPVVHERPANAQTFRDQFRQARRQHRLLFSQNPLRYFDEPLTDPGTRMASRPPALLYNFLAINANRTTLDTSNSFTFEPLLAEDFRDGDSLRMHALEIQVLDRLDAAGLCLVWRVDRDSVDAQHVSRWMEGCTEHLQSGGGQDSRQQSELYADSGLDADELDRLLDSLE